jgi:surface polysaccharide O-acyltransferase-like enzyme
MDTNTSANSKRKRIFYLDQLKTISIFLIILIHVTSISLIKSPTHYLYMGAIYDNIARVGVPIFIMVSGALLLNREYKTLNFLKKRFKRILIPATLWCIIYAIYTFISGNNEGVTPNLTSITSTIQYIINMFLGQTGYLQHYWFIWMILSVYLVAPIINKWIKNSNIKEVKIILIIWLITCIFTTFSLPYINIDLRYFAGPLGYFILGYYLHNTKDKIIENKKLWPILFIIATIIKGIIIYYNLPTVEIFSSQKTYYYDLLTVFQATGMYLTMKNISFNSQTKENINNFMSKKPLGFLNHSLSSYTFGIYLANLLILRIINPLFILNHAFIYTPIVSLLILFLTWIILLILNKIPIIKKLSGTI